MGTDIGYFTSHKTSKTCPANGISTTYYTCPDSSLEISASSNIMATFTFEDLTECTVVEKKTFSPTVSPTVATSSSPSLRPGSVTSGEDITTEDSSMNLSTDVIAGLSAAAVALLFVFLPKAIK